MYAADANPASGFRRCPSATKHRQTTKVSDFAFDSVLLYYNDLVYTRLSCRT